ncbi:MAG TPA: HAD family hydrolase [Mobilitalea sp.]|nr:HAD family hydrolase [Mobilitalea sp.]
MAQSLQTVKKGMVNNMQKPKMILFDYGQTLIAENRFDGEKGTRAVLKYATKNPYNVSAKQVQDFAKELNRDIGRYDPDVTKSPFIEIHNLIFQKYLYDYFDLEFNLTPNEVEKVFWDNASAGKPTNNVKLLLDYLKEAGTRTAVISNISYSGRALEDRINTLLPDNNFEFILATSEYVFRKPHSRIYEFALRKARLNAREVWYCGDNAYFDVEGSSKVGIYPVWYRSAMEDHNKLFPSVECLTVNDWVELIDKLKEFQDV